MKFRTRADKSSVFGAAQDLPASLVDSAVPVHVSDAPGASVTDCVHANTPTLGSVMTTRLPSRKIM